MVTTIITWIGYAILAYVAFIVTLWLFVGFRYGISYLSIAILHLLKIIYDEIEFWKRIVSSLFAWFRKKVPWIKGEHKGARQSSESR